MRIPLTLISLLYLCYCDYPFFPSNLGMKIIIGLRGLCKTFNSIKLLVIPLSIGPMKIPLVYALFIVIIPFPLI